MVDNVLLFWGMLLPTLGLLPCACSLTYEEQWIGALSEKYPINRSGASREYNMEGRDVPLAHPEDFQ